MSEIPNLHYRVASGHLRKKLLPAIALATGLGGCATEGPMLMGPSRAIEVSSIAADYKSYIMKLKLKLKELDREAKEGNFNSPELVKKKRNEYFYKVRYLVEDPELRMYENLSSIEKHQVKKDKYDFDKSVNQSLEGAHRFFSEEHLKFKPWQKNRFDELTNKR